MSVAPGSGVASFRVLYIALIYMSLEINLAYTLPRHPPPPPPPPLRHLPLALASISPSPSLLGGRRQGRGAPRQLPQLSGCGGDKASSPGAVAAGWAGREGTGGPTAAGAGQEGGDMATGCLCGAAPGNMARGPSTARWARRGTYVMSMDWFSRSGREGAGVRLVPPREPWTPTPPPPKMGVPEARGLLRSMSL